MWHALPSPLGNLCFGYLDGIDLKNARVSKLWSKFRAARPSFNTDELEIALLSAVEKLEIGSVPDVDWASVARCSNLTHLDCSTYIYWAKQWSCAEALRGKSLTWLNLEANEVTPELCQFLMGFSSTLQELELSLFSGTYLHLLLPILSGLRSVRVHAKSYCSNIVFGFADLSGLGGVRAIYLHCAVSNDFFHEFRSDVLEHFSIELYDTENTAPLVHFLQQQRQLKTVEMCMDEMPQDLELQLQTTLQHLKFSVIFDRLDLDLDGRMRKSTNNMVSLAVRELLLESSEKLSVLCFLFPNLQSLNIALSPTLVNCSILANLGCLEILDLYIVHERFSSLSWLVKISRLKQFLLGGSDLDYIQHLAIRAPVLFDLGKLHASDREQVLRVSQLLITCDEAFGQ